MASLRRFVERLPIGRRLGLAFGVLWTMMLGGTGFALLQMYMLGAGAGRMATLVVGIVVCLALSFVLARLIQRSITEPLTACVRGLDALARQEFEPVDVEGSDEIGRIGAALNESIEVVRDALYEVHRASDVQEQRAAALRSSVDALLNAVEVVAQGDLTVAVSRSEDPAVARIGAALERLFLSLRESLGALARGAHALAGAAHSVTELGTVMGQDADRTSERAERVTAAATEVSAKVQMVSDRAEDLLISVQDIFENTSRAADVATRGVQLVEGTGAAFERLRVSSAEIDDVIKLITSIAAKTDMLALNATIEAARAGAAGRGFAVVAREVKDLAGASAQAAEQVASQIQTIQRDTATAAESLQEIREVISQIDAAQASIASAVQQQSETTSYITMNMSEAATASGQIVDHISTVSEAAAHTSNGAQTTLDAAHELARLATELSELVARFRYEQEAAEGGERQVA